MSEISNIKALTFDTGGTILDWHSGFFKGFEDIRNKYNSILMGMASCF